MSATHSSAAQCSSIASAPQPRVTAASARISASAFSICSSLILAPRVSALISPGLCPTDRKIFSASALGPAACSGALHWRSSSAILYSTPASSFESPLCLNCAASCCAAKTASSFEPIFIYALTATSRDSPAASPSSWYLDMASFATCRAMSSSPSPRCIFARMHKLAASFDVSPSSRKAAAASWAAGRPFLKSCCVKWHLAITSRAAASPVLSPSCLNALRASAAFQAASSGFGVAAWTCAATYRAAAWPVGSPISLKSFKARFAA
mmetsp:Transcript_139219/g.388497  ORF Transcript_139219/g.388497 Transcript_139219/m.388497 type:complete len:267 (-) Transcript_139219:330-1130(-)